MVGLARSFASFASRRGAGRRSGGGGRRNDERYGLRPHLRRDRPVVEAAARILAPVRSAGHGRGGRAGRVAARRPHLRGGDRDRQDPRVPRSRRRRRRQGRGLHRHPPSPGEAVQPRSAAGLPGSGMQPAPRVAQGPLELPLPLALRAGVGLGEARPTRRGREGGGAFGMGVPDVQRRPRGGGGPRGERSGAAGRHLDGGQLPRVEVSGVRRMPRGRGPPPRREGGRGGGQPPPAVRRHGAQGARVRRAAAARRYPGDR